MSVELERPAQRTAKPGFLHDRRPEIEENYSVARRSGPPLFFARYRHDHRNFGFIEPVPLSDRLMVAVEFRAIGPLSLFRNGRHIAKPARKAGALGLYDMRESWAADLRDPSETLSMFLPLQAFSDFGAERNQSFVEMQCVHETPCFDDVMLHLAQSMIPALSRPHEISAIYLDHIFLAIRDHLAATYGVFHRKENQDRSGLSGHQANIALEFIEANLSKDLGLEDIARACGASVSSLTRGFKSTLGLPPHQWVLGRRVVLAQRLMRETSKSLSEIAVMSGFSDQSHLSRVFTSRVGVSPAYWRRQLAR
jgi:AraC family transcriptional regulator